MALDLEGFNELNGLPDEPDATLMDSLRFDDALEIPWQMTDLEMWMNYCDEDLYELDKLVLGFIRRTTWARRTKGQMKFAVPIVFAHLFGRKPTSSDSRICRVMHTLLTYYCTRKTGVTAIKGQRFTHVYYFSRYAVKAKRPYSLRLRLEERNEESAFRPYGTGNDKRTKPGPGDQVVIKDDDGTSHQVKR